MGSNNKIKKATDGSKEANKGQDQGKDRIANPASRSLGVAARGISSGKDFACFMSALMSDLIEGSICPQVGNAACNAGGKLLKVVEMQHKYGRTSADGTVKDLELSGPSLQIA